MADDKFKLPRSSYEELSKIIKAYGHTKGEASIDNVAQLSGINRTRISANNAFLVGVEIVAAGKNKITTQKGADLALALEHEMPNEIALAWRKIVNENDFLSKMVQAVRVRKGMEVAHLENHIAYSAGEAKAKEVLTGARAVVDILRASGLVREEGDKILPNLLPIPMSNSTIDDIPISQEASTIIIHDKSHARLSKISNSGVTLHIEVRINANVNELDDLGEKLKNLIESLSDTAPNNDVDSANN